MCAESDLQPVQSNSPLSQLRSSYSLYVTSVTYRQKTLALTELPCCSVDPGFKAARSFPGGTSGWKEININILILREEGRSRA